MNQEVVDYYAFDIDNMITIYDCDYSISAAEWY